MKQEFGRRGAPLKTTGTGDPWTNRKPDVDPWISPERRKREHQLLKSHGILEDCAFGVPEHHERKAARSAVTRVSRQTGERARQKQSLMPGLIAAAVFVVVLVLSAVQPLTTAVRYGMPELFWMIWVRESLPLILFLAVGMLAFLRSIAKRT